MAAESSFSRYSLILRSAKPLLMNCQFEILAVVRYVMGNFPGVKDQRPRKIIKRLLKYPIAHSISIRCFQMSLLYSRWHNQDVLAFCLKVTTKSPSPTYPISAIP